MKPTATESDFARAENLLRDCVEMGLKMVPTLRTDAAHVIAQALAEERAPYVENLTATQERCSTLIEEARAERAVSAGRLREVNRLAEENRALWIRAENAEADAENTGPVRFTFAGTEHMLSFDRAHAIRDRIILAIEDASYPVPARAISETLGADVARYIVPSPVVSCEYQRAEPLCAVHGDGPIDMDRDAECWKCERSAAAAAVAHSEEHPDWSVGSDDDVLPNEWWRRLFDAMRDPLVAWLHRTDPIYAKDEG